MIHFAGYIAADTPSRTTPYLPIPVGWYRPQSNTWFLGPTRGA